MAKLIIHLIIGCVKFYKYFISPFFVNKCRYLPTCSEYFIESLKVHGLVTGLNLGIRRVFSCHPLKLLGGGSGLDYVPKKKFNKGKV